MGISPYAYCANDPVNRIDPDGRKVVAIGVNAQKAILNTLPSAIRNQIEFDSQGCIDKSVTNKISSESRNFASLSQLVNDDRVYEINVADKITYKDENGALIDQDMGRITLSGYQGSYGFNTGEDGWLGVTQTPGNTAKKYNSPDDRVIITINQELSVSGQAQTFAHEGYGHAYLYSQGLEHMHRIVGTPQGFKEKNETLDIAIRKAIAETIINMNIK